MPVPLHTVDAFTAEPFAGNPAAVCLLDGERDAGWMQKVAAEMNLSETAFLWPKDDGWSLRWFTPAVEVSLCGHATLASAHVLWETGALPAEQTARFHTMSGPLQADRRDGRIQIDLPAIVAEDHMTPDVVIEALDMNPAWSGRTVTRADGEENYLLRFDNEDDVRGLQPDFRVLRRDVPAGVIVTAASSGGEFDFVSRYFASAFGIDEDPVTGAAHCTLVPYWTDELGKTDLVGFQASARGGVVHGRRDGDRVLLSGDAVTVVRGELRD